MSFEDFSADLPNQIVLGLFNSELQAAYLLAEVEPNIWDCHFTSRRDADKSAVLSAAKWIIDYFKGNGLKLRAYVTLRNKPLQAFAEAAGLRAIGTQKIACQAQNDSCTLPSVGKTFIVYGG